MENRHFNLEIFGLTETEQRAVTSVCNLTRHRRLRYEVIAEPGRNKAHIALVDGDDPVARRRWQGSQSFHDGRPRVLISRQPDVSANDDFSYSLNRSHFAARLIRTLDDIVAKQIEISPDLKIDDDGNVPEFSARRQRLNDPNLPIALVVEDSATARMQMRALLELVGMRVELADSAERGLEAAARQRFDIVFMDIELPGMDGYAACRKLKSRDRLSSCPVVMLTARDGAFDRIRGMMAGCNRYLIKPVAAEDLYGVLKELLPQAVEASA